MESEVNVTHVRHPVSSAGQSYEIRMLNQKLLDDADIRSKYVKVGGSTVVLLSSL